MLRALPGGRTEPRRAQPRAGSGADKLACLAALEQKVLWLSTWMIHHANHLRPKPRRAEGRRPPGVVRLGRDADDRALFRRAAARRTGSRSSRTPRRCSTPSNTCSAGRRRDKLERFRALGGAQSYPSRTKDGDDVDFSTGSVGLGRRR